MTRIIAGTARGRRLAVPPTGTRPTSDRAREGLFNSLTTMLDFQGARVLDLYAGSGAVGLEALSRGAEQAVLVESDRTAVAVIESNVAAVGLPGALIERRTVASYLGGGPTGPFDVIFADPPYALPGGEVDAVLAILAQDGWSLAGTEVVLERPARSAGPVWPEPLVMIKQKRYGESSLWYGRRR
jgi:16S rRNA (guanine966-N2)-methyltransferase